MSASPVPAERTTAAARAERRRARSRDHLRRSAAIAFGKSSYTRTSVESILVEADVTRATFYRYFDSKDDVFARLVDDVVDELIATIRLAAEETSIRARLRRRTSALIEVASRNRGILRAVAEAVHVNPDHAARWGRLRADLEAEHEAALAWCARHGLVDASKVEVMSRVLSGLVESVLLDERHDAPLNGQPVSEVLADICWNSLFRSTDDADLDLLEPARPGLDSLGPPGS